ncbi:ATP-binding cassette domain-containing protein [Spirochaetota bacterium]
MTENKKYAYRLSKIEYLYNGDFKLEIPHLEFEMGKSLGISGPNGCGKSTLLKILALIETPQKGSIEFMGTKLSSDNFNNKNKLTFLPQTPYLLKRSIFENVAYGLKIRKEKDIREKVNNVLKSLGLPIEKFGKRKWHELSGGEAQRVALASRLVLKPHVLILDEPISNIDKNSAELIKNAILNIRKTHKTSIIVTSHDILWLNEVADEILRLQHGRIVGSGNDNVIEGPWSKEKKGLWAKTLPDGYKIFSSKPPDKNSIAILSPTEVIIAENKQSKISAQNMLKGEITNMSTAYEPDMIMVNLRVHGIMMSVSVTQKSVTKLKLHPGKKVWLIFKATSFHWQ